MPLGKPLLPMRIHISLCQLLFLGSYHWFLIAALYLLLDFFMYKNVYYKTAEKFSKSEEFKIFFPSA